jgi:TonB family protein
MTALAPIVAILLAAVALPALARPADAETQPRDTEGCTDLKLFPRLAGCVIQECSAKLRDSLDTSAGDTTAGGAGAATPDGSLSSLVYSCAASMDLARIQRELNAEIRTAGYRIVAEQKENKFDPDNPVVTARKGSRWLRWSASSDDGISSYSLSSAGKLPAESCTPPALLAALKQCEVVECSSKVEDSVAMRTGPKAETSLTGNVQTVALACPSAWAAQALSVLEGELKSSGFKTLFSDREQPENAWITGRAGARWVEFVGSPDGESVDYTLTMVPSAEVLTAEAVTAEALTPVQPAPAPAAPVLAATPAPPPAPEPSNQTAVSRPITPARTTPIASYPPVFIFPKPTLKVPIEATPERLKSVRGEVVIHLLVDVSEDGTVTNAVLTGRVTPKILKLESAAREAVSHWRFEPARQDGRIVACVKIPVEIHFQGRPWIY